MESDPKGIREELNHLVHGNAIQASGTLNLFAKQSNEGLVSHQRMSKANSMERNRHMYNNSTFKNLETAVESKRSPCSIEVASSEAKNLQSGRDHLQTPSRKLI
jgi:hypothetical protein